MITHEITQSLEIAVGNHQIPQILADEITAALVERDELRAYLSRIAAEVTRTAALGGYAYEIDGVLVGEIDTALRKMDAKGE